MKTNARGIADVRVQAEEEESEPVKQNKISDANKHLNW